VRDSDPYGYGEPLGHIAGWRPIANQLADRGGGGAIARPAAAFR
jgi:hypothetical protein